jgi:murein DD-endopeptidase MepM/ murein hydrolase activator NlpD
MSRNLRLGLLLLLCLVVVAPAAGTTSDKRKQIHRKIEHLQGKVSHARKQKAVLTSEISRITGRMRFLRGQIGTASVELGVLQTRLATHERILNKLNARYTVQAALLKTYRQEYARAETLLQQRLVAIYKEGQPDPVTVVLSSHSISSMIDGIAYTRSVANQDRAVTSDVLHTRNHMAVLQAATEKNRKHALAEAKTVADAAWHTRETRDALAHHRDELSTAAHHKNVALSVVTESEQSYLNEIAGLQAASARLEIHLRSSGSHGSGVSSSGLMWPVNGPITSPFGERWGRMHEGIDIGVGYGTPIQAAAGGTVVYAGWESGYGNFVVIDHGNGLATAYGHQSRIAVSNGESVSQGQVIGYVGCTGHCFGPHLHFEVRVNGSPVDPLGYL